MKNSMELLYYNVKSIHDRLVEQESRVASSGRARKEGSGRRAREDGEDRRQQGPAVLTGKQTARPRGTTGRLAASGELTPEL